MKSWEINTGCKLVVLPLLSGENHSAFILQTSCELRHEYHAWYDISPFSFTCIYDNTLFPKTGGETQSSGRKGRLNSEQKINIIIKEGNILLQSGRRKKSVTPLSVVLKYASSHSIVPSCSFSFVEFVWVTSWRYKNTLGWPRNDGGRINSSHVLQNSS